MGGTEQERRLAACGPTEEHARSVLSRYELLASRLPGMAEMLAFADSIRGYLEGSFVFDPQPRLMCAYERIGNRVLARGRARAAT